MKLNKQMKEKIEIVANEQGLKINSSNFAYIACDCITNELIDILIEYDVSVQDVQMIGYMFQKKLCKLGIKKEDIKSSQEPNSLNNDANVPKEPPNFAKDSKN